jgi:hypothetical protein
LLALLQGCPFHCFPHLNEIIRFADGCVEFFLFDTRLHLLPTILLVLKLFQTSIQAVMNLDGTFLEVHPGRCVVLQPAYPLRARRLK